MERISYSCAVSVSRTLYSDYLKFCPNIKIWSGTGTCIKDITNMEIQSNTYTGTIIAPSENDLWTIINHLKLSKQYEKQLLKSVSVDDLAYRLVQIKDYKQYIKQKQEEEENHEWNCGTCLYCDEINGKSICKISKAEVNETDFMCEKYVYPEF
jgi:hypothetical protein